MLNERVMRAQQDFESETVNPHKTKTPIEVSFYCVAFIDVLNQTDVLRRISKFPENEEEKRDFTELWRQSVGRIRMFRSLFDRYFDPFVHYKPRSLPVRLLPKSSICVVLAPVKSRNRYPPTRWSITFQCQKDPDIF